MVLLSVGSSSLVLLDMEVGLMRTGWGVAVSWIIFSCATGYGGRFDENWLGCCC